MPYISNYDIDHICKNILDSLKSFEGEVKIKELFLIISSAIKAANNKVETCEFDKLYAMFVDLIRALESDDQIEPTLIALKNDQNLFDLYIIPKTITATIVDVAKSEAFFAKIREEKIEGNIIPNIPFEVLFNFLKAYYIYRGKVEISEASNNPACDYNNHCLEMKSISEIFNSYKTVSLYNILVYPKDFLPYSLEYLDDYVAAESEKNYKKSFEIVQKAVIDDKYYGSTLKKFCNKL